MALQVNPLQAEAALPPGAIFSRSFPGILGSSDSVQIHHHLDKDLNLPPLPAHLHDQDFSANGAHHHGLCHHVRFREHHSNDCTVHATRAHLGSCCPRELHQSHGFLVCECFSEHHRRLPDTCPAYARCQKLAATSTTAVGSHNGLRLGWLVRLSSSRLTMSTIWTTIEANTAIICACLPMLKSPLAALFPRLFPRGSADEYSNGSNAAQRRGMYMQGQYSSISAPCLPSQDILLEQKQFFTLSEP